METRLTSSRLLVTCLLCGLYTLFGVTVAMASGTLVWQIQDAGIARFGQAISGAGDLDGDGREDVLVGAGGGRVKVLSGLDGSTLRTFHKNTGSANASYLGWSLDDAGDFNDDGYSDFLIGARAHEDITVGELGYAVVVSGDPNCNGEAFGATCPGASGACALWIVCGATRGDAFGHAVANAGDVNEDGTTDFLVGAPGTLSVSGGSAALYSGADGTLLWSRAGVPPDNLGYSLDGLGDVSGDGIPDFIVGAPNARKKQKTAAGRATVYSGSNFKTLFQVRGMRTDDKVGHTAAAAGLVDFDNRREVLISFQNGGKKLFTGAGEVQVLRGNGSKLLKTNGVGIGNGLGIAIKGIGDVNDDGVDDFAASSPRSGLGPFRGEVIVFSGRGRLDPDGEVFYVYA
jgi:FG-GAP repeat protein